MFPIPKNILQMKTMFPLSENPSSTKINWNFFYMFYFHILTPKRLELLKQIQIILVLSFLFFLISASSFSDFVKKSGVGWMTWWEKSLIDCTCVGATQTYMPRTVRGRVPWETHFWKEWLTQAPPILSSVPKNRCQLASVRHRAKINSSVPSTCLIDPSVELASTPPIAFRGLGNLLYTKHRRKLFYEEL